MFDEEAYYSKKAMNKEISKREKKGWQVVSVDVKEERPCACCLLGLFSFLLPKMKVYYVTYRK